MLNESFYGYELRTAADWGINPGDAPETRKEQLRGKNTVEQIKNIFYGSDKYVITTVATPERHSLFAYTEAPGQYGDLDVLFWATESNRLQPDSDGHVSTDIIWDYSPLTQFRYLQGGIALLKEARNKYSGMSVKLRENNSMWVRDQNGKDPSKTLAKPHLRVSVIDKSNLIPQTKEWRFDHLLKEQEAKRRLLPRYLNRGKILLQQDLMANGARLIQEKDRPVYGFVFPIPEDELLFPANIERIRRVLGAHASVHERLDTVLDRFPITERAKLMRKTWRMAVYIADEEEDVVEGEPIRRGELVAKIGTQPYSGAGPMEDLEDINLKRMPGLKPRYQPLERRARAIHLVVDARIAAYLAEEEARQQWLRNQEPLHFPVIQELFSARAA